MSEPVSGRAVASLVCGILAFNGCPCLGGILAIVLGWGDRSGVARAGVILGCIHLGLMIGILIVVGLLLLAGAVTDGFR